MFRIRDRVMIMGLGILVSLAGCGETKLVVQTGEEELYEKIADAGSDSDTGFPDALGGELSSMSMSHVLKSQEFDPELPPNARSQEEDEEIPIISEEEVKILEEEEMILESVRRQETEPGLPPQARSQEAEEKALTAKLLEERKPYTEITDPVSRESPLTIPGDDATLKPVVEIPPDDSGIGDKPVIHDDDSPLDDIYFDFDQWKIRADAVTTLQKNAALLLDEYQNYEVLIEGHCDERGTVEYNFVLGRRRAESVKKYLIDLNVPEERLKIVSYGKERPSCHESKPECWQKNRRAHSILK